MRLQHDVCQIADNRKKRFITRFRILNGTSYNCELLDMTVGLRYNVHTFVPDMTYCAVYRLLPLDFIVLLVYRCEVVFIDTVHASIMIRTGEMNVYM